MNMGDSEDDSDWIPVVEFNETPNSMIWPHEEDRDDVFEEWNQREKLKILPEIPCLVRLLDGEVAGCSDPNKARAHFYTPQAVVEKLFSLFRDNDFPNFKFVLMRYLYEVVPKVFAPSDKYEELLHPTHDDKLVQELIFTPLESLLLLETEPREFNDEVARTDVPTGNCGRVFKSGEATYSCRDCGADPTCVLCTNCFNHSIHKNHRYKMSSSIGGGYCDCGDTEAWKEGALCTKHQTEGAVEGANLPPKKEAMARLIFETLLPYANNTLSNQYAVGLECLPMAEGENGIPDPKACYFSTILYNDEVHTFELVIHTLTRTLQMDRKTAVDFATKIDREGRAVISSQPFPECIRIKQAITRATQRSNEEPLKVEIRQSALVAHQNFAAHLLKWITGILNLSSAYRKVFYEFSSETQDGRNFLETIILNDTKFWKAIRDIWHHLLIAGVLKEYSVKKHFAEVFTNCYGDMMTEFSLDDQEHAYSVTSLSVQIFTVPSLAHFLIEEKDVLFTVMRAILSDSETRLEHGKLQYQYSQRLRRTHYCLSDLKYLLSSVPKIWTPKLRHGFMEGFTSLVRFCSYLHESDPIVRQTGDHIEFEPDWETGFNTNVKLAPVLALFLDWCASDKEICMKAFRKTLQQIKSLKYDSNMSTIVRELADHSATCYVYNVSERPVSIYLPLTRLQAGLYLALQRFDDDQRLVRHEKVQALMKHFARPEILIEAPMRTLTLAAQGHVGMWRRNGFSLLNQLYFYQNVRCRSDMFDRDLLALQVGAAEIESNEFLIHLLNRLNILHWVYDIFEIDPPKEEESIRQTILMVEEFLLLIMFIVSGRFCPGVGVVTFAECVAKQIVQSLCIGPMTHSELNRYLAENVHGETGIDLVIKKVAECKKSPQGDVYELRQEYYAEFDVFYYHYVREEMSKAEEAQRARKLAAKEPDFFPPPKLPAFTPPFTMVLGLLKADVLMHIFHIVIERWINHRSRSFSDALLRKVLHLIGYGLREEIEKNKEENLHFFQFTETLGRWGILTLLQEALLSPRSASHKEMILWIINTHGEIRPSKPVPVPVNPEQLLLKEAEETRLRKEKAAAARARSMASISSLQKKFRIVNADLFAEEVAAEDIVEVGDVIETVCLGSNRAPVMGPEEVTCILCMAKEDLLVSPNPFVVGCFIHQSSVLEQKSKLPLEKDAEFSYIVRPELFRGHFIGSCGHVMHKLCWKKHYENIVNRERRRPYRQMQLFEIEKKESLCPMCECLHNANIPVLPPLNTTDDAEYYSRQPETDSSKYDNWLALLAFAIKHDNFAEEGFWSPPSRSDMQKNGLSEAYETLWTPLHPKTYSQVPIQRMAAMDEFLVKIEAEAFIPPIYKGKNAEVANRHTSLLSLWNAVAFTITSIERANRELDVSFFGTELPSRQQLTLKYLTRLGGSAVDSRSQHQMNATRFIALRIIRLLHEETHPEILKRRIPIERMDPLSLLVTSTYALPFLFTETRLEACVMKPVAGSIMDVYIFRTFFFLHMTQILCQSDMYELISNNPQCSQADTHAFQNYCRNIWGIPSQDPVDWNNVIKFLEDKVVPFVSCCCKFYECYTGIEPVNFLPQRTPLNSMLKFLGQPTDIREFFTTPSLLDHGYKWVGVAGRSTGCLFPRRIQPFISLPMDYLDLINSVANFACPTNKQNGIESRHPTICLICGAVLCSQMLCCQTEVDGVTVGNCTLHALACGHGTCIYLRVRDCKAFLIASAGKKGTYVAPPYVDEYGETDQGLRRGNPLRFSPEKYDYLRKLWVNHAIPEEIVRTNERNSSVPSLTYTDWARL